LQGDPGGDGGNQFWRTLTRASKADIGRIHPGIQRHLHFSQRSDIQAIDLPGKMLDQRRHRIGLDGIVQFDRGRQNPPQPGYPLIDQAAVIGINGVCPTRAASCSSDSPPTCKQSSTTGNWLMGQCTGRAAFITFSL
jgi:hypothetical protein